MDHLHDTHPVLACAAAIDAALKDIADLDPAFMRTADKRVALLRLTEVVGRLQELRLRVLTSSSDVADEVGARDVAAWLGHAARLDRGECRRDLRLGGAHALAWRGCRAARGHRGPGPGGGHRPRPRRAARRRRTRGHGVGGGAAGGGGGPVRAPAAAGPGPAGARRGRPRGRRRAGASRPRARGDARGPPHLADLPPPRRRDHRRPHPDRRCRGGPADDLPRSPHLAPPGRARGPGAGPAPLRTPAGGRVRGAPRECGPPPAAAPRRRRDDRRRHRRPRHVGLRDRDRAGRRPADHGRAGAPAGLHRLDPSGRAGRESEVLDLGRARRLFTPAQRKALALRDRRCRAEGCDIPSAWCEAHHARAPWAAGGRTDLDDGLLLCSWHHHRAHDHRYDQRRLPTGDVRFSRRT